jgi:hypothetical protein
VLDLVHGGEDVVQLGDVGHDRPLVGAGHVGNVLSIKDAGHAKVLQGNVEGQVEVSELVLAGQISIGDQVLELKCE